MDKNTIWIGLDVHAESITVAEFVNDAQVATTSEFANEPKVIAKIFKRLLARGRVVACYEAGPTGYVLCRQLRKMGVNCTVIAPSLIPKKPGDRIKNDKRDAVKLGRLLRAGELTAVWVPTEEDEAVRDLMRAREDVRRDRSAAAAQQISPSPRPPIRQGQWLHAAVVGWCKALTFPRHGERVAFEHYIKQVEYLDERVKEFEREIREIAESPLYRERVLRLCSLRGISTLTAMVVISELYDLRRFDHPRELMSFIGLIPSERSSGPKERRGGITKTGNTRVRRLLVEAAWAYRKNTSLTPRQRKVLQKQPPEVERIARKAGERLGKRYRRLVGRGKKANVACTAVARELCGFLWSLGQVPAAA